MKEGEKQKNRKIDNKKVKRILIYIIVLAILLYVLYTIYLLIKEPTNVMTVVEGEITQEETLIGYVIRNEQVVQGKNYKNGMEQIKSEGERASKGENIFRY